MTSIWETLGVEAGADTAQIRRAYARRLKVVHPEDDAEGFQRLRQAYEMALAHSAWRAQAREVQAADPGEGADGSDGEADGEATAAPVAVSVRPARTREPAPATAVAPDAFQAACARLVELAASKAVGRQQAEDALRALLACAELEDVDSYGEAEAWVAELILAHIPTSDPLTKAAVEVFGWTPERNKGPAAPLIQGVVGRREDIRFLDGIDNSAHPHHRAFAALTRKPTPARRIGFRLTAGLADEVAVMLDDIRHRRTGLAQSLDPEATAWWDAMFAKPRLSAWSLSMMIALPLCCAVGAAALPDRPWFAIPAGLVGGAVLGCALGMGHLYLIQIPRGMWMRERIWQAPAWQRLGWGPAALLLLALSAAAPPAPWTSGPVALAAIGIVGWALITGTPDTRPARTAWPVRALIGQVLILVWWAWLADDLESERYWPMTIAFAAVVGVSMAGAGSLLSTWAGLARRSQAAILAALAVATPAAGVLAFTAHAPMSRALAAAAIVAVIMAHRPIAAAIGAEAGRVRYYVMLGAGLLAAVTVGGGGSSVLVGGGIGLLAGVGVVLAAAGMDRR